MSLLCVRWFYHCFYIDYVFGSACLRSRARVDATSGFPERHPVRMCRRVLSPRRYHWPISPSSSKVRSCGGGV